MFKYRDEVYIGKGFYRGQYGIIESIGSDNTQYNIILRFNTETTVIDKNDIIPYDESEEGVNDMVTEKAHKIAVEKYNNLSFLGKMFSEDPDYENIPDYM